MKTQGGLINTLIRIVACWGLLNICLHDPLYVDSVRVADQCS